MSSSTGGNLVGIDLGTTVSVISHLDDRGAAVTIPNREGDPLTPSAIYLDGTNVLVGKNARLAASDLPDKVATVVKRDMGKPWYSAGGKPRLVDGRKFRPETLSAMILRKLKQDAERRIGPISRAVITVPAYFDDARRKATEDAGRIAGLEVMDIINEPTAAALDYCLEGPLNPAGPSARPQFPDGKLTALVYDLGGGTFDVTVIRLQAQRIDTLATDGAVKLGGKDWDDRIVRWMAEQFASQHGVQIPADRQSGLAQHAETAKMLLSQLPTAPIECYYREHALRRTLARGEFEELTRDLLKQTEIILSGLLDEARRDGQPLAWTDIDRVLLVGGSTRMPMVRQMLRRVTGKEPDDGLDPDQAVARGAAIFAAIRAAQGGAGPLQVQTDLQQQLQQIGVVDVNAHSLGVEAYSRKRNRLVHAILIPKNTQLPFAASKVFPLHKAGTTALQVKVREGEVPEDAEANILLGQCQVSELPPGLPSRSPIQVRLSCGTNGRVSVMALDMTGGRFAQTEIQRRSGLTEQDILRETELLNSLNIQ